MSEMVGGVGLVVVMEVVVGSWRFGDSRWDRELICWMVRGMLPRALEWKRELSHLGLVAQAETRR